MKDKIVLQRTEDNKMQMIMDPLTIEVFFQMMFSGILNYMNTIVENAKGVALKKAMKERLYDVLNIVASNTLEQFAPDLELRPNLTAQAILEMENKILDRQSIPEAAETAFPVEEEENAGPPI